SKSYSGLATGTTNFFVVTSLNSCGESQNSSPPVSAATCSSVPAPPIAPTITSTANACILPKASETVTSSTTNTNITNGSYIFQGTGQHGNVNNYFYIVPGSSPPTATGIALKYIRSIKIGRAHV